MPKYSVNKLVRDEYPAIFTSGNQVAEIVRISDDELKAELLKKIIEEVREIDINLPRDEIIAELADIKQAMLDFERSSEITDDEVEVKRIKKAQKLGGFTTGVFVKTIELSDDDEWNEYYRKRPDLYPEE